MKNFLLAYTFLILSGLCHAQKTFPAYAADIQNFKKQDSANYPPQNAILLVGSSSFTRWTDVNNYFPGYTIINRGFGGSTLKDVIRYTYDIIIPYQPKQIVIYCGENDVAEGVPAEEVFTTFKTLYQMVRTNLPSTVIHFVSLKPSPSRQPLLPEMKKVNQLVNGFIRKEKNAGFINVFPAMLNKNGEIMEDIFVADSLHLNAKGYAIWQKVLQPHLVK